MNDRKRPVGTTDIKAIGCSILSFCQCDKKPEVNSMTEEKICRRSCLQRFQSMGTGLCRFRAHAQRIRMLWEEAAPSGVARKNWGGGREGKMDSSKAHPQ